MSEDSLEATGPVEAPSNDPPQLSYIEALSYADHKPVPVDLLNKKYMVISYLPPSESVVMRLSNIDMEREDQIVAPDEVYEQRSKLAKDLINRKVRSESGA